MRDLLRYMLIAVLVVVVGWFLIGELKEWTIVDNSVNIEDSDGWELLYNFSTDVDPDSYLRITFDFDFKDYEVYFVNFIIASHDYDVIYNSHFITLDKLYLNFITTDSEFVTYMYNLTLSLNGNNVLVASVSTEFGSVYCGFDFFVEIWGVK